MENQRDADGRLVPDRKRFPSGMKALADYVHNTYIHISHIIMTQI